MKSPQRKLRAFFCLKSPNSSSFGVASPVSCTRHGVLVFRVFRNGVLATIRHMNGLLGDIS